MDFPYTLPLIFGGAAAATVVVPDAALLTVVGSAPAVTLQPPAVVVRPGGWTLTVAGATPRVTPVPQSGEPTPAWAQSVDAFANAQRQSVASSSATPLQFPDTSQLGGLCGGLLGGSAFTGGLVASGNPDTNGTAGALVSGSQGLADTLCGFMGGAGSNTSPQTITAGAQDVSNSVNANPMASGTIAMGQPDGPTGNAALDAINGLQLFADNLYGIFSGCGCAPNLAPDQASPQQIIDTAQQTSDGVTANPMAAGLLSMGQDGGGSGNVALDAINGGQLFANTLFNLCQTCGCSNDLAPDQASPQAIIDTSQQTVDAYNNSAMATGIVQMGQDTAGPSGNVAVDALNGGQSFADSIANIFSLCGLCTFHNDLAGARSSEGPLRFGPLTVGAVDTAAITPQNLLDAAQQTVDAFTANPYSRMVLDVAGGSGNLVVDAINGGNVAASHATAQQVHALTKTQEMQLVKENLLVANDFGSADTVVGDTRWSWDGSTGDGKIGCAKVVCNGSQEPLVSSEIYVVAGQTIEVSARVEWTNIHYTGRDPIVLAVEKYRRTRPNNGAVGTVYADIGWTNTAALTAPALSSGWVDMAGTYVVEPGVDQLRIRLEPAKTITSGTVRFDNADFLKLDLIADEVTPGVGLTVDSIVNQLYGDAGTGFTHNDAAVALGNNANSLVSMAGRTAALEAQSHTGAIAGDDFTWTGDLLSTANVDAHWGGSYTKLDWTGTPTGSYAADGNQAVWQPGGPQICWFDWTGPDAVSETDYQLVQLVLGSRPLSGTTIRLVGRISADWASYVFAEITGDGTYKIGYRGGGTTSTLAHGQCATPGLASTLALYLGDAALARPRRYQLVVGSQTICDTTDVGTGSPVSATNRGWGWGAATTTATAAPPKVDQWLGFDQ